MDAQKSTSRAKVGDTGETPVPQAQVDAAVAAGREALGSWADREVDDRAKYLHAFGDLLRKQHAEFTELICQETGKPRWESATETDAMIGKIAATIEAHAERRAVSSRTVAGIAATTRYKPHGVVAVLGPFNFPGHLPNGHIMPALLAGNTVIFKPSELTPRTGQRIAELWQAAGLPAGVLQVVQGARAVGEALVQHPGIDGVFFTGSFEAGRAINRALADHPGKIVALEMGGNNPLLVHEVSNLDAAAYWTIQSAYISAGQRCSCARRLIVVDGAGSARFLAHLAQRIRQIRVGHYSDDPQPFMGPLITEAAADRLLEAQESLLRSGGTSITRMERIGDDRALLRPGLIDVTGVSDRPDVEHFGPLLQLIRVRNFGEAIAEANRTRFGLSAGLFSDDAALWEPFRRKIRAGVVNFNRPLTGASALLPFGGVGHSGNHRASAYFAADYSSYPVASMEAETLKMPQKPTPGVGSYHF
jgi:succinylglutamic semialdehyde dehydrogenase